MAADIAFQPSPTSTVNINVSASSQNGLVRNGSGDFLVTNLGTATVWIDFGTDNTVVAAVATGMPIPAGSVQVVHRPGPVYVAAIAAGSTGLISFTPGDGM